MEGHTLCLCQKIALQSTSTASSSAHFLLSSFLTVSNQSWYSDLGSFAWVQIATECPSWVFWNVCTWEWRCTRKTQTHQRSSREFCVFCVPGMRLCWGLGYLTCLHQVLNLKSVIWIFSDLATGCIQSGCCQWRHWCWVALSFIWVPAGSFENLYLNNFNTLNIFFNEKSPAVCEWF